MNSAWTPPSAVPSGFLTNRASRTGPFDRQERRDRVGAAAQVRECDLRIHRGARAADRRLRMAPAAAIEVHARPEAFVDFFRLVEVDLAGVEVFELLRGQPGDGVPDAAAPARTPGSAALTALTVCDAIPI